jgi:hypothetical protein
VSIGALELASLFRKYTGTLADIDLEQNRAKAVYGSTKRDLDLSHSKNRKVLSEKMSGQGLGNSGISLKENVDLNTAYANAGADVDAQNNANLAVLAKKRLDAKAQYDEGTALSKMTSLLQKQAGE